MTTPDYSFFPKWDPVPDEWFEAPIRPYDGKSEEHKQMLTEELAILKAFYHGVMTAEEAAYAITRPISTSSIPVLNTYSDECIALFMLWRQIVNACEEWPASRIPDLVALLSAISKIPDHIHRGEATDDEDEGPLGWDILPYFAAEWRDAHWRIPMNILQDYPDTAARLRERGLYIRAQEVESQLVAAGIWDLWRAINYVIWTLEMKPNHDYHAEERTGVHHHPLAFYSLELDFQVPAVACWIKHNGQRMHQCIARDGLKGNPDLPTVRMHFGEPIERWAFWKKRLLELANDPDDFTRRGAQLAIGYMDEATGSLTEK
ncbi:hypothetical protein BDV35DRAFT_289361 [Aspergillus flavus]|uniref:Unnamed protein product n=2 Tax=Aspergillus subgen. Circumdati TaxID=2720871 RepID=A0A1S9D9E0_ASPOZ|nr:uncharacterized protein G4B84_008297 [Aspergillus flavus NRRL3357]KAB8244380.1 hypothetical protein BDV35DRAFT_289361 [Aspergillus flavus]OOO05717.1 Protein of unknown function DUF3632 [Aspergillus oryzae]KAF7615673.1 hypothetical protein AFLA_009182 [Aspergillus flavus NRRL3357]QMW32866.1 hypothetical protein G4B84_008297 [Aspergillus flavus NRRL3357]RMZ36180.1 hypothetical protein CA14_012509 [Aspergillus flavus]